MHFLLLLKAVILLLLHEECHVTELLSVGIIVLLIERLPHLVFSYLLGQSVTDDRSLLVSLLCQLSDPIGAVVRAEVAEGVLLLFMLVIHELHSRRVASEMSCLLLLVPLVKHDLVFERILVNFNRLVSQLPSDIILVLHCRHHVFKVFFLSVSTLFHHLNCGLHSSIGMVDGFFFLVVFQESVGILGCLKIELKGKLFVHVDRDCFVNVLHHHCG